MPITVRDFMADVHGRYDHDAEFHARVHRAVDILNAEFIERNGSPMDNHDYALARYAASAGVLMAERNPLTGGVDLT